EAHNVLGTILYKKRCLDEAIAEYQKAIDLKPDLAVAHNNIGLALAAKQRFDEAIDAFARAIRLNPDYWQAHNNIGNIFSFNGQWEKAIAAYRKAIGLKPDFTPLLNDLAWLLATCSDAKLRDPEEAVLLANRAVKLAPNEGALRNTLGVALYRAEKWQLAIDALRESMDKRKGGDSSDWFFLAMSHRKLDHQQEARQWYDKAVQWMVKNKPQDEELRRFRAEAAECLNIEDKLSSKPE